MSNNRPLRPDNIRRWWRRLSWVRLWYKSVRKERSGIRRKETFSGRYCVIMWLCRLLINLSKCYKWAWCSKMTVDLPLNFYKKIRFTWRFQLLDRQVCPNWSDVPSRERTSLAYHPVVPCTRQYHAVPNRVSLHARVMLIYCSLSCDIRFDSLI